MDSVTELWRRIDTWLQTFAPQRSAELLPGVTPQELVEAETAMGLTLPADFKASYRIHNGAEGNSGLLMGYPDFYQLSYVYSFGQIFPDLLQDAKWANRVPGFVSDPARQSLPIQRVWCHPQWVAFAGDGSGYHWCLDLAPAPGGTMGQVITYDHEDGPANLLFPSFEALLSAYADHLEAGLYIGSRRPLIPLEKLTRLQERRTAFQQPSPAKSVLFQAIRSAWEYDTDKSVETFKQVLQREAAFPEDRCFALYGLIACCENVEEYEDEVPSFVAQLEAEAHGMPETHWVHEEVTLLKYLA